MNINELVKKHGNTYTENEELASVELLSDSTVTKIEEYLGYKFENPFLVSQAFIHSSVSPEFNNEVLEFIGDRILDLVVTKDLADNYVSFYGLRKKLELSGSTYAVMIGGTSEAELTEMKSYIVRGSKLEKLIKDSGLYENIITGRSDKDKTVKLQGSVQENLFEALIGAVTLDCEWDMQILTNVVHRMHDIEKCFDELDAYALENEKLAPRAKKILENLRPKLATAKLSEVNLLQELVQAKLLDFVDYEFSSDTDRDPIWSCECSFGLASHLDASSGGSGNSKADAKKEAASLALSLLWTECEKAIKAQTLYN